MDVVKLQMQFVNLVDVLLSEGILDDQFKVLYSGMYGDNEDPSFVIDVLTQYLTNFDGSLANLSKALETPEVDFYQVYVYTHRIKGSSSWIGAQKVTNLCLKLRDFCEEKKLEECLTCLQRLKNDHAVLKDNLQKLIKLESDVIAAGGRIPPFD